MKGIFKAIIIAGMLSVSVAACSKVPAGNVGVKVYLLGSSKGVDNEVLGPGRYWIGWNEDLYLFPTFTQNFVWTEADQAESPGNEELVFQDSQGLVIRADVGISYAIDPDSVSQIFQKYRRGVDEITKVYLRNMVRDALVSEASTMKVDVIYGAGKEDLMKRVEDRVRAQVEPIGIKIERIYWIGSMRLPENVVQLINDKIGAAQKTAQRQQEIEEEKAKAQKKIEAAKGDAESIRLKAIAQAEANRIISESLTEELVSYKALETWDGVLPKITGGATPFVSADKMLEEAPKKEVAVTR